MLQFILHPAAESEAEQSSFCLENFGFVMSAYLDFFFIVRKINYLFVPLQANYICSSFSPRLMKSCQLTALTKFSLLLFLIENCMQTKCHRGFTSAVSPADYPGMKDGSSRLTNCVQAGILIEGVLRKLSQQISSNIDIFMNEVLLPPCSCSCE